MDLKGAAVVAVAPAQMVQIQGADDGDRVDAVGIPPRPLARGVLGGFVAEVKPVPKGYRPPASGFSLMPVGRLPNRRSP